MRTTVTTVTILALAVAGVTACDMSQGPGCNGSQCAQQQDDDDDWEIDIDGHRVRKTKAPVAVIPGRPIAPVKPAAPAKPPTRRK